MIEYHNDILGIEVRWLAGTRENPNAGRVITYWQYKHYVRSGKIEVIRQGKGKNNHALVRYDNLPSWIKDAIVKELGKSPYELHKYRYFRQYIVDDEQARIYFVNYTKPDGSYLTDKKRLEYYTNSILLNAIINYVSDNKRRRRAMGNAGNNIWVNMSRIINELREEYNHTLPKTPGSLRNKVSDYKKREYLAVVSGKIGNRNRQKVTKQVEQLIVSLAVMENKPYEEDVLNLYIDFITGETDIYIKSGDRAGEILNPAEFYDKNGNPIILSKGTVRNILQRNKHITDKKRNDWLYYNNLHRPHHHRKPPRYSLSKLTLDDRDLPPLLTSGTHIKAYFVWDVASEAIIGVAFSTKKDEFLFVSAMQDAFRHLYAWGLNMPLEIEVEHHLVKKFKTELEILFPFVRWAVPGNAQEKRAEHYNRRFKYQYEKQEFPTGRFYAKLEANRPKVTKIWTEKGMEDKQKRYAFNDLIAIYGAMIDMYNNDEHSKIKGKTRLEVLKEFQNPKSQNISKPIIAKSFGYKTKTSLRRSQYVRVQYADYQLPSPYFIEKIDRNQSLEAYYLPELNGEIPEVYIYQNGDYITTCNKIKQYNEARSEWTEADAEIYEKQSAYVAQFDKMIKEQTAEKIMQVGTMKKEIEVADEPEDYIYEVKETEIQDNYDDYETSDIISKAEDY